jgi:hypothetical protein
VISHTYSSTRRLQLLTNIGDQIVKGGDQVVNQIAKGGGGFLKSAASFVSLYDIELHINAANQDLAKSNNAGVASELKQANKALRMIVASCTV